VRLVWTARAISDLIEVRAWVEKDNPQAAADLGHRILEASRKLVKNPEMGRRGSLPGIRELVISRTQYLIPCRVRTARIELLRVIHGRRQRPG